MSMTVADLRHVLADLPADAVVRLATQPGWPLAHDLAGVSTAADLAADTQCEVHADYSCDECLANADKDVVWLVEGESVVSDPYAPRGVWDAAVSA